MFVILIILVVFVYLCPLFFNRIENKDFKSTCMLFRNLTLTILFTTNLAILKLLKLSSGNLIA